MNSVLLQKEINELNKTINLLKIENADLQNKLNHAEFLQAEMTKLRDFSKIMAENSSLKFQNSSQREKIRALTIENNCLNRNQKLRQKQFTDIRGEI